LDNDGHGTMLAGTVLGTAPNARGLRVLPVKFFGAGTEPTAEGAVDAIYYALDQGAHIINLSFDLGLGSTELEEAIQVACNKDVLVVIAAGNTGSNNDTYRLVPACYADAAGCRAKTIVVMATDWYDERPTFSNFGPGKVDLAAPGVRILSTRAGWKDGRRYRRYTGTSPAPAACPAPPRC
jgi:subtilisin family serine protease